VGPGAVEARRWRTSAVADNDGGGQLAGPALCYFFFFLLFVGRLNSGARQRTFHAVSKPSRKGAVS
jgi:hypothetical protein